MELIFYVFAKAVDIYLGLASLAMLLRVILQFFAAEGNRLLAVCYAISEPVILPFRFLLSKLGVGQNSIIDIPFFAAYFSLSIIQMFLPAI